MEQIFVLMMVLGAFCFLSFGICVGNSIEAKESKITANIMTIFSVLGMLSLIIGFIGLLIINFK